MHNGDAPLNWTEPPGMHDAPLGWGTEFTGSGQQAAVRGFQELE